MLTFRQCMLTLVLASAFLSSNVSASDNAEKLGDILYVLLPTTAYGSTFYHHDKEGRKQFYKSIATNTVATLALKNTVKKQRPNGEDNKAFPSGHTSTSFQSAVFLHKRYGLKFAIPHYIGASYVAYNRVDSDNHDTTDVLAGALVGSLSSYYFTTHFKPVKGLEVKPIAYDGTYGANISLKW